MANMALEIAEHYDYCAEWTEDFCRRVQAGTRISSGDSDIDKEAITWLFSDGSELTRFHVCGFLFADCPVETSYGAQKWE